ncbi:MAG: hypothetical protein GY794_24820, partial [bacterium]|nr:hypothetical protein [bacterium]
NAVSPEVVLLSASQGLDRFSSPNPARDKFISTFDKNRQYYNTPKHGWIQLTFSKEGTIRAKTMHTNR